MYKFTIYVQYRTKYYDGRITDDQLGRSTLLSMVDLAIGYFKLRHNGNIHQTIPFAVLNINSLNIVNYSMAIDQVALSLTQYSNIIGQTINN